MQGIRYITNLAHRGHVNSKKPCGSHFKPATRRGVFPAAWRTNTGSAILSLTAGATITNIPGRVTLRQVTRAPTAAPLLRCGYVACPLPDLARRIISAPFERGDAGCHHAFKVQLRFLLRRHDGDVLNCIAVAGDPRAIRRDDHIEVAIDRESSAVAAVGWAKRDGPGEWLPIAPGDVNRCHYGARRRIRRSARIRRIEGDIQRRWRRWRINGCQGRVKRPVVRIAAGARGKLRRQRAK